MEQGILGLCALLFGVPFIAVDDPDDRRLDEYRNVPDPELAARRGLFVAEGRLVVGRLVGASPLTTRSVMLTTAVRASLEEVLAARPELPVYVVPQTLMNGVAGFEIHRGCLAIGERPHARRWPDVAGGGTIVVLERVANADNVGAVFRNAAAFGAAAVLLDPSSTDPLYRKAIRTSMGAALLLPFARAEPWPDALQELRKDGYALVAMTPASTAPTLRECAAALQGHIGSNNEGQTPNRVAIVLGHEGDGLTPAALDACDHRARIPMTPGADSLNVATAAAVALYELGRS
jgi:tRNA G18 (ribose-2'-O)-methylase SpoU